MTFNRIEGSEGFEAQRAGFCVIYRWRFEPGSEEHGIAAWERLTRAIARECGGLGSRLHRTAEGWFVAYAQWPDEDTWKRSQASASPDPQASDEMASAIVERLPPIRLNVAADLLGPDRLQS
ncbi:MAG: antibiotic biosynthesis monooxygenase [Planctomycetota bacterium]|jgi:heme-degrading monooxygenase HmoA